MDSNFLVQERAEEKKVEPPTVPQKTSNPASDISLHWSTFTPRKHKLDYYDSVVLVIGLLAVIYHCYLLR
jgi:hypothetical protein